LMRSSCIHIKLDGKNPYITSQGGQYAKQIT